LNTNLVMEMGPASSESLKRYWGRMLEGAVEYNAEWMADHGSEIRLPTYEEPRSGGKTAAQRIGTAPVIISRGKATCAEWAAVAAAQLRLAGDANAKCVLIDVFDPRYGTTVDYDYHVIVRRGDGTEFDPTQDLPGYRGTGDWVKDNGHCCRECALKVNGHKTPCTSCRLEKASGGCSHR